MLWIKTFHLLFVISWFAGLFYLPRIFVNLAQTQSSDAYETLIGMAKRLYRFMTILAVPAIGLGLWLWLGYDVWQGQGWLHAKLFFVVLLIAYHFSCSALLRTFIARSNSRSQRFYRWYNEVPVILLLIVLILVITRPF